MICLGYLLLIYFINEINIFFYNLMETTSNHISNLSQSSHVLTSLNKIFIAEN